MRLFHQICTEKGIVHDNRQIFEYLNTFEEKNNYVQLSLFDEIREKYFPVTFRGHFEWV